MAATTRENIRILHSGSNCPGQEGFQEPWFYVVFWVLVNNKAGLGYQTWCVCSLYRRSTRPHLFAKSHIWGLGFLPKQSRHCNHDFERTKKLLSLKRPNFQQHRHEKPAERALDFSQIPPAQTSLSQVTEYREYSLWLL